MNQLPPIEAPFGSWASSITADRIVSGSIRLVQPSLSQGCCYWIESRPQENGRSVLVCLDPNGQTIDLTPAPFNARSTVHEYGGGAYLASAGNCWFVNFDDQRIYATGIGSAPRAITAAGEKRYADLCHDATRNRLIAVCEDHSGTGEAVNSLVSVDLRDGTTRDIVSGCDFYSSPRLSPDGRKLAWLCWNHPHLPWDQTELWVAKLDEHGQVRHPRQIGGDKPAALLQPEWRESDLYFVSDAGNWWNLYRWDGEQVRQLTDEHAELGQPHWMFAMRSYGLCQLPLVVGSFVADGRSRLYRISLEDGSAQPVLFPYSHIEQIHVERDRALLLAGAPDRPMAVIDFDLRNDTWRVLREAESLELDASMLAVPQAIEYPTSDGESAHALYYPATNAGYRGSGSEKEPLLVKCHGGPTAASSPALDLRTQYWTSRGIGVLDVNYRGSTGYGREYRHSLYGRWGKADVDDAVFGARHLADEGIADNDRMMIRGGSAGGYTVLCALTFHDAFRAGASYYGIGDLESMFAHTHKFESHYDHQLLGLNGNREQIFEERSPSRHAEKISCPVIFFQGLEDKVVPPGQSEHMVEILRKRGIPVAYLAFAGEAHGFRQAENIRRALEAELAFYARILRFEPYGDLASIQIENLD